jgi:PAS domain S-box-containing protein
MRGYLPETRGRLCILVVDDSEAGSYAKTRILRQAGYSVSEARSGRDALRRVAEDAPDLVLLDVRLPDISGLEVCCRIKENPKTSPVPVLQTSAACCDDPSKVAGFECGADAYLNEPVEPSVLIATIAALLRMRRADQAIRQQALEWQLTFDAISDGVALTDTKGRIIRSNASLAALSGRRSPELTGTRIDELLPPIGSEVVWGSLENGLRQRTEASAGDRLLSLIIDPVRDDHGKLRGAVCIVSDVTANKAMNERLWQKQRLDSIGILAGGVAHDFNNILMGILGNASLGLEKPGDVRLADEAFRDILRAGERAAHLTRQLLAYAGKGRFSVQPLDLSEIVTAVLPLAQASIAANIQVALNLQRSLPMVSADKMQVEQILMSLLINAAEAIGENTGIIRVSTREVDLLENQGQGYLSEGDVRGRYVMLEVVDNGVGMDEETARQIFDPFFTTKFLGRGLGLSAVWGIIRAHQGAIRVTSAPGKGAAFELLFPCDRSTGGDRRFAGCRIRGRIPRRKAGPFWR